MFTNNYAVLAGLRSYFEIEHKRLDAEDVFHILTEENRQRQILFYIAHCVFIDTIGKDTMAVIYADAVLAQDPQQVYTSTKWVCSGDTRKYKQERVRVLAKETLSQLKRFPFTWIPNIKPPSPATEEQVDIMFKRYIGKGFDINQMFEIKLGLQAGVDVTVYDKHKYEWRQMREIREGLQSGVDVAQYADMAYNHIEMRMKRTELESRHNLKEEAGMLDIIREDAYDGEKRS